VYNTRLTFTLSKKIKRIMQLICDEILLDTPDIRISSLGRKIKVFQYEKLLNEVGLPFRFFDLFNFSRLCRRLFRTNKMNLLQISGATCIVLRGHKLYLVDIFTSDIKELYHLPNTRNVMANSICKLNDKGFMFGDYYANNDHGSVNVYYTPDVFKYPVKTLDIQKIIKCRHIHNIQVIDELGRIFVSTGDFDGECWILEFDDEFTLKKIHGDGSQRYRTCAVHYFDGRLYWGMDSPLEKSHLVEYSYSESTILKQHRIPGPCWYSIGLGTTIALSTANEPSHIRVEASICLFDLKNKELTITETFYKDRWPYIFKFGTITLKNTYAPNEYWQCFEALTGRDGMARRVKLNE
jgi:hypothetical protein